MKVKLKKMSHLEFNKFREYSIGEYAKDIMKAKEISSDEANKQAEAEFIEMLPQGIDTKDNAIMAIKDYVTDKTVGVIWYMFEVTDGVSHTFLCEFIIREEERRKGYATAALAGMEDDAKSHGCTESRLYVWKHNPPGLNLYIKSGYTSFRDVEDGMYMRKVL